MTDYLLPRYNVQIIGCMNPLLEELYPEGFSSTIKTRLRNACLIGEILSMLGFGFIIDKIGRRTVIFFAIMILILGCCACDSSTWRKPIWHVGGGM
jgi:MFS family permease